MNPAATPTFRENRARFPLEELRQFDGKWVAFSADGQRIVASGSSIMDLASQLRAARESLQDVALERIEIDSSEINLGGAELL